MILVVPFIYLLACLVSGLVITAIRRIEFWKAFILSLLLTPIFGGILSFYLKQRPKAYCMSPYLHFEVGSSYSYKRIETEGKLKNIWVYSDQIYRLKPTTFYKHFSIISENNTQ